MGMGYPYCVLFFLRPPSLGVCPSWVATEYSPVINPLFSHHCFFHTHTNMKLFLVFIFLYFKNIFMEGTIKLHTKNTYCRNFYSENFQSELNPKVELHFWIFTGILMHVEVNTQAALAFLFVYWDQYFWLSIVKRFLSFSHFHKQKHMLFRSTADTVKGRWTVLLWESDLR